MKPFNQSDVSERYQKLPEPVREVIVSNDLVYALGEALDTLALEDTARASTKEQLTLVLVGLSRISDLEQYLLTELHISENLVQSAMKIIRERVLTPLRTALLATTAPAPQPEVQPPLETPQSQALSDPYREIT